MPPEDLGVQGDRLRQELPERETPSEQTPSVPAHAQCSRYRSAQCPRQTTPSPLHGSALGLGVSPIRGLPMCPGGGSQRYWPSLPSTSTCHKTHRGTDFALGTGITRASSETLCSGEKRGIRTAQGGGPVGKVPGLLGVLPGLQEGQALQGGRGHRWLLWGQPGH